MKKIFLLVAVLSLTACASMISGTKENFIIRSEDKDAKLYLNDEYIGEGAGITTISKKKLKDAVIKAEKKGCKTTIRRIETKIDPTSFLGCFIDACLVSVLAIDWGLTGAIQEATQTSYFVTPICD